MNASKNQYKNSANCKTMERFVYIQQGSTVFHRTQNCCKQKNELKDIDNVNGRPCSKCHKKCMICMTSYGRKTCKTHYVCDECFTNYLRLQLFEVLKCPCEKYEIDPRNLSYNHLQLWMRNLKVNEPEIISTDRKTILEYESLFTEKCPNCEIAFYDFDGCLALHCDNCKTYFCGLCFEIFPNNTHCHNHILSCKLNPKKEDYFLPLNTWKKLRIKKIINKKYNYIKENCLRNNWKDHICFWIKTYSLNTFYENTLYLFWLCTYLSFSKFVTAARLIKHRIKMR